MNRDPIVYVSPTFLSASTITGLYDGQGDDADHFNPDRFIDDRGQLAPALAGTKDGALSLGMFCITVRAENPSSGYRR